MKRKSKVLGAALLSAMLVMGSSLVALAGSDPSVDSSSETVGNYVISFASQVEANSGTAYTTGGGSNAYLSVDGTYYYYLNDDSHTAYSKPGSAQGYGNAQVVLTCQAGYTTNYLTATHNATVGNAKMGTKTTTAFYIKK